MGRLYNLCDLQLDGLFDPMHAPTIFAENEPKGIETIDQEMSRYSLAVMVLIRLKARANELGEL